MKHSLIVIALVILILGATQYVQAHVLKVDRSIGAVLHIDPDDDPIVGEPAYFFFEFKDKKNVFKPEFCDCTVSIIKDGISVYSQPLFQDNPTADTNNASFAYIFPEKNIYQVKVEGNPNKPKAFQPFSLTFDIRVARTSDTTGSTPTRRPYVLYAVLFIISFVGTIALNGFFNKRHRKHL